MDFYSLQPNFILNTLQELGLKPDGTIQQLNSLENRVFDLRTESGSHLVAKFYRPERWSRDQIQEEHDFLFALESEEIPVCVPLRISGQSVFEAHGLYAAVWNRTGGRLVDEFTTSLIGRIGGYLGRMHNAGEKMQFTSRPAFDGHYMIDRHWELLDSMIPAKQKQRIEPTVARLKSGLQALATDSAAFFPIHGDCHTGNILIREEKIHFLDFDDSVVGPVVQDIWMIISDTPEMQKRKLDALIEGYEQFRSFPAHTLKYIELMRGLRYFAYTGWIAKRKDDPAIQKTFPEFGNSDFWDSFADDLLDQLEEAGRQGALDEGPEELAEEEQWSDTDYFYDMDDEGERWSPGQDS
jgi:Ser/Thr protein kinase RdoA (MazF antagonist)